MFQELLKLQEDMQLDIQLEKQGDDAILLLKEMMAKSLGQLGQVSRTEIRDKLFEIAEPADGALSDEVLLCTSVLLCACDSLSHWLSQCCIMLSAALAQLVRLVMAGGRVSIEKE